MEMHFRKGVKSLTSFPHFGLRALEGVKQAKKRSAENRSAKSGGKGRKGERERHVSVRSATGRRHFGSRKGEGEDGDVVFLAPGASGCGDLLGGLGGDLAGAVETEELAGPAAGFNDAVG